MIDHRGLNHLLRSEDGDAGCASVQSILHAYVELELAGEDPAAVYPGAAIHFLSCTACASDCEGLLYAAHWFGNVKPR
jgi:hypothetical protein